MPYPIPLLLTHMKHLSTLFAYLFMLLFVVTPFSVACQDVSATIPLAQPTTAAASNTLPVPTVTPNPSSIPTLPSTPTASPLATIPPTQTPIVWQRHAIQSGETLTTIAAQYGLTVDYLREINYLADTNTIFVGQELLIPPLDAQGQRVLDLPAAAPPYIIAIVGHSEQNRAIERYIFGSGPNQIVFVGSMHGGYEWNTAVLAYQAIDYFAAFPQTVPPTITLHIIPTANPDGLYWVTNKEGRISAQDIYSANPADALPGRFNANGVDLNRNWDCNWSTTAVWRDEVISGGTAPFSEKESQVLRDFLLSLNLQAVIFWHSAAATVIPGGCNQAHPPSVELANVYRAAANYLSSASLGYAITGDVSDWLAHQDIAAITVELTNHTDTDWPQNLNGILAVLNVYR